MVTRGAVLTFIQACCDGRCYKSDPKRRILIDTSARSQAVPLRVRSPNSLAASTTTPSLPVRLARVFGEISARSLASLIIHDLAVRSVGGRRARFFSKRGTNLQKKTVFGCGYKSQKKLANPATRLLRFSLFLSTQESAKHFSTFSDRSGELRPRHSS